MTTTTTSSSFTTSFLYSLQEAHSEDCKERKRNILISSPWLPASTTTALVNSLQQHLLPRLISRRLPPHSIHCIRSSFARNATRYDATDALRWKSVDTIARIVSLRYQVRVFVLRRTGERNQLFEIDVQVLMEVDVHETASCVPIALTPSLSSHRTLQMMAEWVHRLHNWEHWENLPFYCSATTVDGTHRRLASHSRNLQA